MPQPPPAPRLRGETMLRGIPSIKLFARFGLLAALTLTGWLSAAYNAEAHDYPWCVAATRFSGDDCAYVSREQCQMSAFGRGTCIRNYAVPDPAEKPVKGKRERGRRTDRSGQ